MTLRRPLILILALTLFVIAACGDDAAVTTTTTATTSLATTTTTSAETTSTTAQSTTTTAPKPEDDRAGGLDIAGGFEAGGAPAEPPADPAVTGYSGYMEVTDDSGILLVNVPVEWTDIFSGPWTSNSFGVDGGADGIGVVLGVAPDLELWTDTWTVPGLFFGASTMLGGTIDELLDTYGYLADECTYDGRYAYDDGAYIGAYDWWGDCGGVGTVYVAIVARPPGEEFTAVVEITMVSEADLAAADEIVGSYYVTGVTGDGGGGALDPDLEPNYGAGELTAGFDPDPQAAAVEAGGTIDVSAYLGGDCAGFVTSAPDLEVTWSGSSGGLLRFFFVADLEGDDTVLVINDPAGDWWCSDDSYGTYNPTIDFATGPDGVYDIWVGTYQTGVLIPGGFYITEVDANHP